MDAFYSPFIASRRGFTVTTTKLELLATVWSKNGCTPTALLNLRPLSHTLPLPIGRTISLDKFSSSGLTQVLGEVQAAHDLSATSSVILRSVGVIVTAYISSLHHMACSFTFCGNEEGSRL